VAADDGKKYDVLVVFFDYSGLSLYLFDRAIKSVASEN